MLTFTAFVVRCFTGADLYVGTLLAVIVTTMAGIKNVAALKFYLAVSLVVLAMPLDHRGDRVLLGRP